MASRTFKAAGAECDSSPDLSSLGMCLVGAPLQKRLGLGLLSLRLASLEAISSRLASRVSGSWVSVLLFWRCISSVVEDLFALGAKFKERGEDVLMPLSRRVFLPPLRFQMWPPPSPHVSLQQTRRLRRVL